MKRVAAVSLFVIAGTFGVARAQAPDEEVRCKDGTVAPAGGEACSNHGGVVREDSPAKPLPALTEALEHKQAGAGTEPIIRCKDGTTSSEGTGACDDHGGISRPAPAAPFQATLTKPTGINPKAELRTPVPLQTARCMDGTLSFATPTTPTCAGHGGIAVWVEDQH